MKINAGPIDQSRDDPGVLVVGADGMIGRRLVSVLEAGGARVLGSTRNRATATENRVHIDLSNPDPALVHTLTQAKIDSVVLCAAVTSMERCRLDPAGTRKINVDNTVALAKQMVGEGAHVIFLSSNTVFDGNTPFSKATDHPNPQTEYGCQKRDTENQLLALGKSVTILRLSKVVDPDMPLFSGWVQALNMGNVVHPFSDSVIAPIPINFTVELLRRLVTDRVAGIVQASACNDISYEDAARYLAKKMGVDCKLIAPVSCTTMGVNHSPKNTTLDDAVLRALGYEAPRPTRAIDQFIS